MIATVLAAATLALTPAQAHHAAIVWMRTNFPTQNTPTTRYRLHVDRCVRRQHAPGYRCQYLWESEMGKSKAPHIGTAYMACAGSLAVWRKRVLIESGVNGGVGIGHALVVRGPRACATAP